MACPGGHLVIGNITTHVARASATCRGGKLFSINDEIVAFTEITCTVYPWHTARYTGNTCGTRYKEIEIGFDVEDRFLLHMLICFDEDNQNTLYSQFNLTKAIGGFQFGFPRPRFLQRNFYRVPVNWLYTRFQQRITINRLLGLNENDPKYIHASNQYFLIRGHLTAKADFVFGAAHRLTFWFMNAAPQWQNFNGGNWNSLEQNIRRYASDNERDLIIYTGTYGVATLPHAITGDAIGLYLYVNHNNNRGLPVPAIFWKFVYEPISQAGIVFIGINNPYQENKIELCRDVSDQLTWLTWKKNKLSLGYTYACSVDEFKKIVDFFPDYYDVSSLLT